ncbi:MAG: hypothetical protein HY517_03295 [Candidatus Aenigmarchaeota archaeon]|nr:hypothetical protein [Candidatus Aenigmarchaeota archaeon]
MRQKETGTRERKNQLNPGISRNDMPAKGKRDKGLRRYFEGTGAKSNSRNVGTGSAALYMVVTDSAGVIGNGGCPENECEPVAFVGQVRTKVSGAVSEGDYILAGNNSVGYAKSKDNTTFDEFKKRVVGIALESKENIETARISVAVGVK